MVTIYLPGERTNRYIVGRKEELTAIRGERVVKSIRIFEEEPSEVLIHFEDGASRVFRDLPFQYDSHAEEAPDEQEQWDQDHPDEGYSELHDGG
jgi:hypothetical protein